MNALQIAKLRIAGAQAMLEAPRLTVGDLLMAIEALNQAASGLTATALLSMAEAAAEKPAPFEG